MSNRQVPAVYRSIIDDVVEKATVDFDEAGVQIEVLHELTRSWEAKVASSRVADFTQDARMGAVAQSFPMLPNHPGDAPGTTAVLSADESSKPTVQDDDDPQANSTTTTEGTTNDVKPVASTSASASASEGTATPSKPKPDADDDEINSDLDDSDDDLDEDDEDGAGPGQNGDLVIALYEKVQRVKNKWKVTLKDGLISVSGKDYLFGKCNGEFEF